MSYSKKLLHNSLTALLVGIIFFSAHIVRAEDEKEFPTPTCSPRPACLDLPRFPCKPPEPIGGFCPAEPTKIPDPSPTTTLTPTIALSATPTITPPTSPTATLGVNTPTPTVTLSPTPVCPRKPEGDADCDDAVDLKDFEIWRQEFTGITRASVLAADFNKDMKADLVDFESWRQTFVKQ